MGKENQDRIRYLFNTAYAVAKAGKPFSDFKFICGIQKKNGLKLGENYVNSHGCTEFMEHIASTLRKDISKEIETVNFISVLGDGSTDKSIIEQEIIYVRYVGPRTKLPVTREVAITSVENATSQGVFDALTNGLSSVDLNLDNLNPDREKKTSLISSNFDGASVNMGKKTGVVTKIKDVVSSSIGIHCVAHKLELAILDACKTETNIRLRGHVKGDISFLPLFSETSTNFLKGNKGGGF
uniref:Zinc finger protein 862-like n=1 Tax=Saccoglossus kowalevskii TaxID=10224 RepID=A0ABM0MF12_SACKO|nr:PREDICTED: zinc finger protein 862-like [Saccoglossus kowalevskii]